MIWLNNYLVGTTSSVDFKCSRKHFDGFVAKD